MKQLPFIAVILLVLMSFSRIDPSKGKTSESGLLSDSIQIELSCPLVLDIGTVYKDTTVLVDCILTNRDSTALILNFSEGFGFRVPRYTRLIQPGETGVIHFTQTIRDPGKFSKSWNFELMNGDKKQTLRFIIKGEIKHG